MRLDLALVAASAASATASGFATFKLIQDLQDNSDTTTYYEFDRSDTMFLNIQIVLGQDHSKLISDFQTLVKNYGSHGVSIIPRVRYGHSDGSIATEPSDQTVLLKDVSQWAGIFAEAAKSINIPVVQAGFLGQWGEWHDGPLTSDLAVKKAVVEELRTSGLKVAIRYPPDHKALYKGDRSVTIHNDCIFNGGPDGFDGGTFPADDRQAWVDYTIQVAGNNTYGGEGCNDAGDSNYDWSNFDDVCGPNGLASYITEFAIAYLNPANPPPMAQLFRDENYADCVANIQKALQRNH